MRLSRAFDVGGMSEDDALLLYQSALTATEQAMGYYNVNVRVTDGGRSFNVRIPIPGADEMDLRVLPEVAVLAAIRGDVDAVPSVLFHCEDPLFQVHEHIDGSVVNRVWPRGVRLPPQVVPAIVRLLLQLRRVPRESLPASPAGWPAEGDTPAFGGVLSAVTERVHRRFRDQYRYVLEEFQVPADPLHRVRERWLTMTRRPFCLVHSDIHRKNMILGIARVAFIDWELALWGDPLYELAVHINKMGYQEDEEDWLVTEWLRVMPPVVKAGWRADLATYLVHERIKDALVGCIRSMRLFERGGLTPASRDELVRKLTAKLAKAHVDWYGTNAWAPEESVVRAALLRASMEGSGGVHRRSSGAGS